MPIFRRLGLRTSREIARERYAVKALRGDFVGMNVGRPADGDRVAGGPEESPGAPQPGIH